MRISTRITLVMAAAGLLVFGTWGVLMLREEREDLEDALAREITLLGNSLRVAMENALRDRQIEDIEETLGLIERIDAEVDVYVYGADGHRALSSTDEISPCLDALALEAITDQTAPIRFSGPDCDAVMLAVPLVYDGGDVAGAVALSRPLEGMRQDLRSTTVGVVGSVTVFVLVVSALGAVLGRVYISRPLRSMAKALAQFRQGDLERGPRFPGDDEIASFAKEFDATVRDVREARERLAQEQERRRSLNQALRQADKLVTIGQLSASLAHEIGSPLQVVQGRARALARKPGDAARTERNAEILVRETDRISRIVEQLLTVTRRRPPRLAPLDLPNVAEEVLDLLEIEARRCSVELELVADAGLPRITADPDQLRQVVLNLVTNALAASPEGSAITVRCGLGEPGRVLLTVEDQGAGMGPEILASAFAPFFTTRADRGGTGLGLSVVQTIVQEHGGKVEIRSAPGRGTTVTVSLPGGPVPMEVADDANTS